MKPYLLSLAVGAFAGLIYAALHVKSPAPPVIALIGLFGMLCGEQAIPAGKWLFTAATGLVTTAQPTSPIAMMKSARETRT
jgi:XapX domain-containing protein